MSNHRKQIERAIEANNLIVMEIHTGVALSNSAAAQVLSAEPETQPDLPKCHDEQHHFAGPYPPVGVCQCGQKTWTGDAPVAVPSSWRGLMELVSDERIESFVLTPAVVKSLREALSASSPVPSKKEKS